jgi:large repetitive protein
LLPGLAVALLMLVSGAGPAAAGINDYTTTLYLSGAASSVLSGSDELVTSAGPGTPAPAPTAALDASSGVLNGTYSYVYSKVDATGGETAVSAPSAGVTASGGKEIDVSGMTPGATVRLYRTCSCSSSLYYFVGQFVASSPSTSTQFVDNVSDATADVPSNLQPLTQNRPVSGSPAGLGYYAFAPGVPLVSTVSTSMNLASPAYTGKGWIVDAPGRVSIPAGTWTFANKFKGTGSGLDAAHLVIGVYVVDDTTDAAVSTVIDPTGAGENMTANIATAAGTASTITTTITGVGAVKLDANDHLYVQYWRKQSNNTTNTTTTMNVYDGIASITHPAANAYPDVPTLGSIGRVNTTPTLSATYSDPDSDTGTVAFQLCSDAGCATVLQSGSSAAGLASGTNGMWTPAGLADGTYYWRAQSTDSTGNVSGWSGTSSFVVDTVPPGAPTLDSPAAAARVNSTQLGATFVDSDGTDSGSVTFQLCSNISCSSVVGTSTSAAVAGGTAVSWTPTGVADGTYYWRLRATDVAGNQTAWTGSQSFVLDTNPPGVPSLTGPVNASYLGAAPALTGTFTTGDVGDSGKLDYQVCSDSGCSSVVATGSSGGGLLTGASGSWTPGGLADGAYFWRSRGQDAAGNQSAWSATQSFTLDTTAPTAPALGAVAARLQITPQLSGTFSDPGATDTGTILFQLCSSAACTTVLQSNSQSGIANNATVNWTPTSLADGLYYFRVRATDTAGNQSTWATGSFTVDTTAPAKPALVSPANAARVNTPQLSATFTNSDPTDSGTVTFQLCSDVTCATVLGTSTSATVGSGAGVSWGAGPLADGTYYWRASSLDAAGNQGAWSSVRSFVLDTVGPAVPTLVGEPAQVDANPSLSASFSDPDAGDTGSVSFQICSDSACTAVVQSGSSPSGIANGADGSWTAAGLTQGGYYWRARAQDAAGNQSGWSSTQQFTLDTTPPSGPSVTASPADGARLNHPPTLSAVYNDSGAGTGSLTFELCATSSCSSPLLSGSTATLAAGATGSWTPSFLFDGLYYWRVQSTDSAGNESGWSSVFSFTVDATPPDVPVLSGAPGMRVQATPALAAYVDDPSGPGDMARIYVQVCSDVDCTTVVTSGYSGSVPIGALAGWAPPAPLADGTYYWRAMAEDSVGNRSDWSATRAFVVDTVAPSAPAPGGTGGGAEVNQPRMSGTFVSSDPGDTGTLEFQLCADPNCATVVLSGTSAPVAAGGTANWMPDATVLEDGVYFWRVRSEDAAGNDSAWSVTSTFTLDRTPPGRPRDFKATVNGRLLTLSWRPPVDRSKVRGYALIVNGKRTRTLASTTLRLRIKLKRHDRRSFAIAAVDSAGNMSDTTRTIATFVPQLAQKQTRSSSTHRH